MRKIVLAVTLLFYASPSYPQFRSSVFVQESSKHERTVDIGKHSYAIEYTVCDNCGGFVPATIPPGQTHYPATVSVFELKSGERIKVSNEFSAEWTPNGCFEDDPHWMVQEALMIALEKKDYCPSRDNGQDEWFQCIEKLQEELQMSADPESVAACDTTLWAHVYHPKRLIVEHACVSVTGKTVDATHGKRKNGCRPEPDGDYHCWLRLDPGQEQFLNQENKDKQAGNLVFEPVCQRNVTQEDAKAACKDWKQNLTLPPVGSHVRITGAAVLDTQHGHKEIHPVSSITVLK